MAETKTNLLGAAHTNFQAIDESELSSPACRAAYSSFQTNIVRASSLLAIPAFSALTSKFLVEAKEEIEKEVLGEDRSQEKKSAHLAELGPKIDILFRKKMSDTPAEQSKHLSLMTVQCDRIFEKSGPGYEPLLEMLLKSILIQLWVSIEVMLGDLWELAVNEHPAHLASLLGKSSKQGEGVKSMPLELLERHNFNLSKVMGTILKSKFHFTVLASAKEAYALAFRKDGKDVQDAIGSDSLRGLAAVRNLLVHKGGVVDDDFIKDSSGVATLDGLRNLGAGNRVFVDGQTFKNIVEPALLSAVTVIKSVDAWLASHPQENDGDDFYKDFARA